MSQIFIRYARSDKSIVDEFNNQLEAAGHPVWVNPERQLSGIWQRHFQFRCPILGGAQKQHRRQ